MSEQSERDRKRYADDPEYRKRRLASINAWRKRNKTKINAKRRLRWATDPEYRERQLAPKRGCWDRENDLKRLYGITLAEYDRLFKLQKGRCATCGKKSPHRLQVDHCHRRKIVRGLLCGRCNRGLGHFYDDPRLLRQVAAYVTAARKPRGRVRRSMSANRAGPNPEPSS